MIKNLASLLMLLITATIYSQNFEGKIIYSNSYESKLSDVTSEQFNNLMGTEQAYLIKEGNYKSAFNGVFIKLQMYRGDENRSYMFTVKSDTLYWEDYSLNIDKAISFEIKKNQDAVLGTPCDVIIVQAEKSKTHYYYNSKYEINPELFTDHNYGNWYYIISKTKALPLKTVFENDQFIMTSVATEITSMELDDNVFEVQNKSKVAKASW